ncbi:MAG: hypothetical protein JWM78_983 [Verrucomicrobiaceae bacterium]|nr:hypothetical protein [Verrucomicrobiaceae bacterium]
MKFRDGHVEFLNLLPAYSQQKLSAERTTAVDAHLAQCPLCREELEFARRLQTHFHKAIAIEPAPYQSVPLQDPIESAREQKSFDKLLARIDTKPSRAANIVLFKKPVAAQDTDEQTSALYSDGARKLKVYRLPLASAATLLIAVVLAWYNQAPPAYRTLANSSVPASCGQLRIRFSDNFSATDLQALLQAVNAQIVNGPSAHGVYTLHVSEPAVSLQRLRLHPAVALVEPVQC